MTASGSLHMLMVLQWLTISSWYIIWSLISDMQCHIVSTCLIQPCSVTDFLAVELAAASTDRELTMRAGLDGTLVLRTKHTHTCMHMHTHTHTHMHTHAHTHAQAHAHMFNVQCWNPTILHPLNPTILHSFNGLEKRPWRIGAKWHTPFVITRDKRVKGCCDTILTLHSVMDWIASENKIILVIKK